MGLSDPKQASVDKLCKDYQMVELEHGEWVEKKSATSDSYATCKARVRRILLGTTTCLIGGFIVNEDKGYVYFLPEDAFNQFLSGDTSILPKVEDVTK